MSKDNLKHNNDLYIYVKGNFKQAEECLYFILDPFNKTYVPSKNIRNNNIIYPKIFENELNKIYKNSFLN